MIATFCYIWLTAIRDRLVLAMLIGIAAIALLGGFVGDKTIVEADAATASFVGAATRLLIVLGLVVFAASHLNRSAENGELMMILSRPISRPALVVAYWASFWLIGALLTMPATLVLWALAAPPAGGLLLWAASLVLEAGVIVAVALLFAVSISSVVAVVLGVLGFYVLARIIGVLLAIRHSELRSFSGTFDLGVERTLDVIAMVIPRLDLFGRSGWLVHGIDDLSILVTLVAQAAAFTALALAAAVFDFERRQL